MRYLIGCFSYEGKVVDYIQEDGVYFITEDLKTVSAAVLGALSIRDKDEPMLHISGSFDEDACIFMPSKESVERLSNITSTILEVY
jgi:hypothetical protein